MEQIIEEYGITTVLVIVGTAVVIALSSLFLSS